MWRSARATTATLALGLTVSAPDAAAQNRRPLADDCDGGVLAARPAESLGAAYERTPDRVWARLILLRTGRDFAALGDSARAVFEALAPGMDSDAGTRMTGLLDSLQQELVRTDTSAAYRLGEGPSPRLLEIRPGDEAEGWRVGTGTPHEVVLTESSSETTRRAVCWTALLARRIADEGGVDARRLALSVLSVRERRWANFERVGYSLTPLELLVNGWCRACRPALEPPRTQIVVGHVLPGYIVRKGAGSRAALGTELAGLLFYTQSRESYWGASFVLAFPQEQRTEMGVVLHASQLGQLGITTPSWFFSGGRPSLFLSVDLYRFLEQWRGPLREERNAVQRGLAQLS